MNVRTRKSAYLEYKQGVKEAILLDLNTKTIFISGHVTYHEHVLEHKSTFPLELSFHLSNSYMSCIVTNSEPDHEHTSPNIDISTTLHLHLTPNELDNPTKNKYNQVNDYPNDTESINDINQNITKSTKTKHKPNYLSDYMCDNLLNSFTPKSSCILYPISHYHSYVNISNAHTTF